MWVLNGPVLFWLAVDILCRRVSRRLAAPVGQKRHDNETCASNRLSTLSPETKSRNASTVLDTKMNGFLHICRGGLALVCAHKCASRAIAWLRKSLVPCQFLEGATRGLFVSHLRPMGLNVLGYQSHVLQRCHPIYGHKGYSHLSSVLALRMFITMQVQHSYNSSSSG